MSFAHILREEIGRLERELSAHPAFVKLSEARRLLALYEASTEAAPVHVPRESAPVRLRAEIRQRGRDSRKKPAAEWGGVSGDAARAVVQRLSETKQRHPTSELLDWLEGIGISVGGASPANTLSGVLSRTEEVFSDGRKGWALVELKNDSTGDANSSQETSPADAQPHSTPVEPGEEVAHDNMN